MTTFKIALTATAGLVVAFYFLIDIIPPRSLTVTRMSGLKLRLVEYARQHRALPPRLDDLPPKPGYDSAAFDGWGRPFVYSFDSSGVVTLRSLGADQALGGDGDKRDITGIFPTRDSPGHSQDRLPEWIQDPAKP